MKEQKYYSVTCKCGHVGGKKCYIPITFVVIAESKKDAANKARWFPRCKHHHKDCILSVQELTFEEFEKLKMYNSNDPYLICKNIQQQRIYDLTDRIVYEKEHDEEENELVYSKVNKTLVRNKKKYFKFHNMEEIYSYAY